ncbi:MAG TPA: hypothetical protein EYP56_16595, partial [Planctomycetaceae bacterium]|nr:hypothetical protein [Planctomycetaceae bacterium]
MEPRRANRWRLFLSLAALVVAWLAFAGWQYRGYLHEVRLIRQMVAEQSQSVISALVGGVRSHRRLGRFFDAQVQGMLDELVKGPDVLAVGIASTDGRCLLSAGPVELLAGSTGGATGRWLSSGFAYGERFHLDPAGPRGRADGARGRGWRG